MLPQKALAAVAVAILIALALLAHSLVRWAEPVAAAPSTQTSASLPVRDPGPDLQRPPPSISGSDRGSMGSTAEAEEELAPPGGPPPAMSGIGLLVRGIQDDLVKLRELKLYGTADRVTRRSTFLREDLLGRSFDMDDPIPPEVLNRYESYTVFTGPNGARFYSFPRDDYPLFFEMMERKDQAYTTVLDDGLVERVAAFAEESIALAGPQPK